MCLPEQMTVVAMMEDPWSYNSERGYDKDS